APCPAPAAISTASGSAARRIQPRKAPGVLRGIILVIMHGRDDDEDCHRNVAGLGPPAGASPAWWPVSVERALPSGGGIPAGCVARPSNPSGILAGCALPFAPRPRDPSSRSTDTGQ